MSAWERARRLIVAGNAAALAAFVCVLDDAGRKEIASHLAGHLRERGARRWDARDVEPLRVAGAACFGGAAEVASWLNRRDLQLWDRHADDAERLLAVLRFRAPAWRSDLALRLVGRLRSTRDSGITKTHGEPGWQLAAGLVAETGVVPPDNDAFVLGWVWAWQGRWNRNEAPQTALADDPLLPYMIPRLLGTPGVEVALRWNERISWPRLLRGLVDRGRVERKILLDACVSRFAIGGDERRLRPAVQVYQELDTTVEEVPVRDFTRLLPVLPGAATRLALEELGRAERAGLLSDELFGEVVGALAFRAEKTLVKQALVWIAKAADAERAARSGADRGGRVAGCQVALATVLGHEDQALRARAVKLAVRLAPAASPEAGDALRESAAELPADLRAQLAQAYGEVLGDDLPTQTQTQTRTRTPRESLPHEILPREFLPHAIQPITTVTELFAELPALHWWRDPERLERVLAALVEQSYRDRNAVAEAALAWRGATLPETHDWASSGDPLEQLLAATASLATTKWRLSRFRGFIGDVHATSPGRMVLRRLTEIRRLFLSGRTIPVLLATPTVSTGQVDPDVLVSRMERLESAGVEPLAADFEQALLRLPALPSGVDAGVAARARALTSQAGRRLARWLDAGGLPQPEVRCELVDVTVPVPGYAYVFAGRLRTHEVKRPRADERFAALLDCVAERPPGTDGQTSDSQASDGRSFAPNDMPEWWAWTLPTHPDVLAAYLLASLYVSPDESFGYTTVLTGLAGTDGRCGSAVAHALACGLGFKRQEDRMRAADALLGLAVRDLLPAAELGRAVAGLVTSDVLVLTRVISGLADAAHAGAHRQVWTAIEAMLADLLPGPGDRPRTGLADLLALAVKTAASCGARADIPGLAEVAARRGSSRFIQEARRLHQEITA
ncbi:hypothetical protein HII36_48680 [Nonomuraea sp. NN258]|uniref:DUF7825 domain-containing protein n=1 Tax=Nonomuraea antri TaxID=2730852 RepID=UPI00156874D9|nr:DUF6493 family protein [Nonomuraea antri]NRQ39656.1 hypothetical protein [Nonomuraea antri]